MNKLNSALMPEQKYSKDGEFKEPVLRCDRCANLILLATLHQIGMCPHCSNIRVANVRTVNDKEMAQLIDWAGNGTIDKDFVALFAPMPESEHPVTLR
jgi:hypothetical protein